MRPITILLAEDHAVVRDGLRSLLEVGGEFRVVGEAADGRQAVRLARRVKPAIVIMDVAMPQLNGVEAARQILRESPATKVLALSAHSDAEYVCRMTAAGAAGYVPKENSARLLVRALRLVAAGKRFYASSIVQGMRLAAQTRRSMLLTAREGEVLQMVAEGSANKQMASALGISIKTVEKHRQRLMDKLGIHDTAGLTRHAIATGVIDSGWR